MSVVELTERRGRILVLGNGVNLVAGKNGYLRYANVLKEFVHDNKLDLRFFDECCKIKPSFVHHALAELRNEVIAYYTTNYDYALEDALNAKYKNSAILVRHLHGEARFPDTCVFFEREYNLKLTNIRQENWYEEFQRNEVHIVGLALRKEEKILYHMLQERRDRIEKLPDFVYSFDVKPVYAWLTYEQHEKRETEDLAAYLRTLSVVPILIPVYERDYISAWECMLGRFLLHCKKIHVSKAESKILKSGKTPQLSTRGLNVSYSSTRSLKYPERVHFKIQRGMIAKHAEKSHWYFYCEIDKQDYIWKISVSELLRMAKSSDISRSLHLYINFETGEFFFPQRTCKVALRYDSVCTRVCDAFAFDNEFGK